MIKKWVISGSYNPNVGLIQNHTVNLSKNLNFYLSKYGNFIVIGGFNAEITNSYPEEFVRVTVFDKTTHSLQKSRKSNRYQPHYDKPPKKISFVKHF